MPFRGNLDRAINRLVGATKRVHDASDAMGDSVHAELLGAPFGTLGESLMTFSCRKTLRFAGDVPPPNDCLAIDRP
jgi:hypothetical protein